MKIAVTGGKGGTGKSTVATSLSIEFSQNNKVMLVDADVECPNDHLLLSVKRKKHSTVYMPIPKWNFKKCIKCGIKKDVLLFSVDKQKRDGRHPYCKKCISEYKREWYKKNREQHIKQTIEHRNANWFNAVIRHCKRDARQRGYACCSATPDELKASYAGVCDICGKSEDENGRKLSMDHCHSTGIHRGFLCISCNRMLGLTGDNVSVLMKATEYLKQAEKKHELPS